MELSTHLKSCLFFVYLCVKFQPIFTKMHKEETRLQLSRFSFISVYHTFEIQVNLYPILSLTYPGCQRFSKRRAEREVLFSFLSRLFAVKENLWDQGIFYNMLTADMVKHCTYLWYSLSKSRFEITRPRRNLVLRGGIHISTAMFNYLTNSRTLTGSFVLLVKSSHFYASLFQDTLDFVCLTRHLLSLPRI